MALSQMSQRAGRVCYTRTTGSSKAVVLRGAQQSRSRSVQVAAASGSGLPIDLTGMARVAGRRQLNYTLRMLINTLNS